MDETEQVRGIDRLWAAYDETGSVGARRSDRITRPCQIIDPDSSHHAPPASFIATTGETAIALCPFDEDAATATFHNEISDAT